MQSSKTERIRLSEDEVYRLVLKKITEWSPRSAVWPFTYGTGGIIAAAVASSTSINSVFRTKFRLGSYGRLHSLFPLVGIPITFGILFNFTYYMKPILLQERQCLICHELRIGAIQSVLGVVLPCVLAPLTSTYMAYRFLTYPIPSPYFSPKSMQHMAALLRPVFTKLRPRLIGFTALQFVVTGIVVDQQVRCVRRIADELYSFDEREIRDLR